MTERLPNSRLLVLNPPERFDFRMFDFMSEIVTGGIRSVIALGTFDHLFLSSLDIHVANQLLIDVIPAVYLKLKFALELSSDISRLELRPNM